MRAVFLMFLPKLEISGWPYREYIGCKKWKKMAAFSEDFLSGDDFEAALSTFCYYHYCANSSEAVTKVNTDQKDSLSINASITVIEVGH